MKSSGLNYRAWLIATMPALVLGLTACTNSNNWRRSFADAEKDMQAARYESAETKLRPLLPQMDTFAPADNLAVRKAFCEVLAKENKLPEAESSIQTSIDYCQHKFGAGSTEQMPFLSLLTGVYYRSKRFDKAEETARKALTIGETKWGKDDSRLEPAIADVVGTSCINGTCHDEFELYSRLLQMRQRMFGNDDQRTCAARQMLAESFMHKKKYQDSAKLYRYNLIAYAKTNPMLVPGCWNTIASVYDAQGNSSEAVAAWKQAIALERKNPLLGGALTVSMQALGRHYEEQGQLAEAAKTYKEVLDLVVAQGGATNPGAADYYLNYARVLKKQGKASLAKQYQTQGEQLQDAIDAVKREEMKTHASPAASESVEYR